MKKSELDTIRSFAAHVGRVMEAVPCLDSSRYPPKTVNAWRMAKKELCKVSKIIENEEQAHNTGAG